jgi:hypothetical protein
MSATGLPRDRRHLAVQLRTEAVEDALSADRCLEPRAVVEVAEHVVVRQALTRDATEDTVKRPQATGMDQADLRCLTYFVHLDVRRLVLGHSPPAPQATEDIGVVGEQLPRGRPMLLYPRSIILGKVGRLDDEELFAGKVRCCRQHAFHSTHAGGAADHLALLTARKGDLASLELQALVAVLVEPGQLDEHRAVSVSEQDDLKRGREMTVKRATDSGRGASAWASVDIDGEHLPQPGHQPRSVDAEAVLGQGQR